MSEPAFQRSFVSGELAPSVGARADLDAYAHGLRTCRNFLVQRHGGVTNRPGLRFVERIKGGVALRAAIIARSPTSYWRLDEFAGTVARDLGSGADPGTISGSPTQGYQFAGHGGYGLTADGANDFITTAATASGTTFSIACWLKPDATQADTNGTILSMLGTAGLFYQHTTGKLNYRHTAADHLGTTALVTGVEVFVVLSVTAGTGTFYVNGVADGTVTGVGAITPDRFVGEAAGSNRLKGSISDLAYWSSVALSPTQIATLYAARIDSQVQLLCYRSEEPDESLLIEAGAGYLRFFRNGGVLTFATPTAWSGATAYTAGDLVALNGLHYYCILAHTNHTPPNPTYWYPQDSNILEVPIPFLTGFNWVQSGRILTLTHRDYAPRELTFYALTRWVVSTISFVPVAPIPTTVVATQNAALVPGPVANQWRYAVSAAAPGSYQESLPGYSATFNSQEPTSLAEIAITWDAMTVDGVACPEYYIYRDKNKSNTLQYVGTATGVTTWVDFGAVQDPTLTPRINQSLFGTTNNYPHRAAYHQQRRFFANTRTSPDLVWGSRVGFPSDFCISSPLQDDDALTLRFAGNQHNPVRHLVSIKKLIALTSTGEWSVVGGDGAGGPLTPSSLDAEQELYVGAHDTDPIVIGDTLLYVQARGSILRDVRFEQPVEGLAGRDLTLLAGHLVDDYTLDQLDYQQVPHSILWIVRSDGTLLGLTYIREQNILAWHRHDTGASGIFEHVRVVPETAQDTVYVIVQRTIGGQIVRYVEHLASRSIVDLNADAFFVDSGLSYSGSPVSAVSGLDHLEGESVRVLGDGVVLGPFTVVNGAIADLGASCSDIHAGLAITADLETLELDVAGTSVRTKVKKVTSCAVLLERSSRVFAVGPNASALTTVDVDAHEDPSNREYTGQQELVIEGSFEKTGRVFLRHDRPLPLTVLGIVPNVEIGG